MQRFFYLGLLVACSQAVPSPIHVPTTVQTAGGNNAQVYVPSVYGYPYGYQPVYYGYYPQTQFRYVPTTVADTEAETRLSTGVTPYRGLFGLQLPGFQSNGATFVTSGTDQVMLGNALVEQNIFTGSSASYTIYLDDPTDNSFTLAGKTWDIYISTDCTTANGAQLASVAAPGLLINGFYAKGTTSNWNIDGTDGKTSVTGRFVVVIENGSTTVRGCTGAFS